MNRLEGKVALVTGAASGIGRATAIRLASEGATVACLDLALDGCKATAADIENTGGTATARSCDVSAPDDVGAAVEAAAADHGRIDVVCNIAGIGRFANSHEVSVEEWQRIIGVNLTGTFLMCRAALPHLLEGGGAIVNTASNAGLQGVPYSAAYCASKGGVVQLTRSLAWEYIRRGVRVNAIAPGGVDTPIQKDFTELPEGASYKDLARIMSPMGNAQPEEVASLFAYLASDEARYVTGAIMSIDGGLTA
jgi:NAD(P)-dependent dehydrogenase (short-subunit alcohol dehydrogenase family)